MLPRKLVNYMGVFQGVPLAGLIPKLVLPVLARKLEDHYVGGMGGPVKIDFGQEAMQLGVTLSQHQREVINSFGDPDAAGALFRFMGAFQADDTQPVEQVEITVRGRLGKLDFGTAEMGKLVETEVEMPLTYFKYTSNGQEVIEIDLIANIFRVNGRDRNADIRRAIGQS